MATYSAPDLPYDYSALAPAISGDILELHHDKHHAAYVRVRTTPRTNRGGTRQGRVRRHRWSRRPSRSTSAAVLHSIFWDNLSPTVSDRPDGELYRHQSMTTSVRFDAFKGTADTSATTLVQGSG